MLTKPIPAWILFGCTTLAGIAGCINAVGFLGMHQALSHMSGTVSNVAIGLGHADLALARSAAAILGFFFFGCVLSGLIIRRSTLKLGRRYGVALAGEAALLVAATYFLRHGAIGGHYLAAMACGLQNAIATNYSGAVIRTTHLTGMVTDLGLALGLFARREPVDQRRIGLYLVLIFGFFAGGVLGAIGYVRLGYDVLLLPAALCGLTGVGYTIVKHFTRSAPSAPEALPH